MIPYGWALVPIMPTERMLNEFSGVWWPNLGMNELRQWTKEKRLLEEKAYAAMLAAAPSPPTEDGNLQVQITKLNRRLRKKAQQLDAALEREAQLIAKVKEQSRIIREARDDVGTRHECDGGAVL